jgi:exodeoxyribonuclease V alpha subunit
VLGDLFDASSPVAVAALTTNRRFPATSGIDRLAAAVQERRGEDALGVLAAHDAPEVELVAVADDSSPTWLSGLTVEQLGDVRDDVVRSGTALHHAAEAGDAPAALAALDAHRLLCAHRRGPRGVTHWSALAERWVADVHPVVPRADGRYAGEPLLVTANDYEIELFNGDTGVVVADGHGGLVAVFGRGGDPIEVPLARLGAVRPLHAMTVHRSQGSQFERITVVLPPAGSPLGTRETLYTAVTRATTHVRVVGSPEALVEAVGRPAARATGLRERLGPAR